MKKIKYMIYDNKAKIYLPFTHTTIKEAESFKENLLSKGEYPDMPHTVFSIDKFIGNTYKKRIS